MNKISYEVVGKDYFSNKDVEHTVLASNPSEAKQIIAKKYPSMMVTLVYPSKFVQSQPMEYLEYD